MNERQFSWFFRIDKKFFLSNLFYFYLNFKKFEKMYKFSNVFFYDVSYFKSYMSSFAFFSFFAFALIFLFVFIFNFRIKQINWNFEIKFQTLIIVEFASMKKLKNFLQKFFLYFDLSMKQIYDLKQQIRWRNFYSLTFNQLKIKYVQNVFRFEIFIKLINDVKKIIVAAIKQNRYERKKSCHQHALNFEMSYATIWRFLKNVEFKLCKLIIKFDFIKNMKQIRLQFCLRHKNWTLKNWKNVIWIDKINVIFEY